MENLSKFLVSVKNHFRRNFIVSLALGALMTGLVAHNEGFEVLTKYVETLYPADYIFNFLLQLFGIYLFLSIGLCTLKCFGVGISKELLSFHSYTEDIGLVVYGVLIAFAGGAVAYFLPMLFVDFGWATFFANSFVILMAIGSLIISAVMAAIRDTVRNALERECKKPIKINITGFPSQEVLISFILSRKAMSKVSSEDKLEKMGFWVFVHDGDEQFVVDDKKNKHGENLCRKVRSSDDEPEKTKYFQIVDDKSKNYRKVTVQLIHGNIILNGVSPLVGVIQHVTHYPKVYRVFRDFRWWLIGVRDKRAYEQYSDRLKVLEALVHLRNKNVKRFSTSSSFIVSNYDLRTYIASSYQFYPLGYELHVEPIIQGFKEEGLVSYTTGSKDVRVNGKAWSALYEFYASDRRHKDSMKLSRWQIIMAFVLTLVTTMSLFKDELPSVFEWLKTLF